MSLTKRHYDGWENDTKYELSPIITISEKNPYFAFYNNIIIMMKTRYLQCVLCTSRYKDKQTSKEHVSYSQIHCGVLSGKYIRT